MIGFKIIIIILFVIMQKHDFYCKNDLAEIIKNNHITNQFLKSNYESVDSNYKNPIFPFKIDFKNKYQNITFCRLHTQDSWYLQADNAFTFFLILKNDSLTLTNIIKEFGAPTVKNQITINNIDYLPSYEWERKEKIIFRHFRNINKVDKYRNTVLIIIGNMQYKDIVYLPK